MLLKNLIKNCPKNLTRTKVSGLSSDSRTIKKGELYFALRGKKFDGSKFISDALKKGAAAVVTSHFKTNKKIIVVKSVESSLSFACTKFFKKKPKNIIAVTGTNGKSSVADFFHQILKYNKYTVATIGTLGIKINNSFTKTNLTTLDIISLHKALYRLANLKIENVLIEASSHGLEQGRLNGIDFLAGIFTNFSQDHLDYHKTMKNYFESKLILFSKILKKNKYIITDNKLPKFRNIKRIAKQKKLKIRLIDELKNTNFKRFKLIGAFQKKNLMMSILAAEIIGIKKNKALQHLEKIKSVKGRMQLARTLNNGTKIYIDFAHTPNAIETSIKTLKKHYNKDVTIVLGCGGERDKKKRVIIGKVINKLCNKIYITDDNPRNENPRFIRKSILKYVKKKIYKEIGSRKKAIETSLTNSNFNEIILIAGKGHEDTQNYGKKVYKISDFEIIKKFRDINKKYSSEIKDQNFNKFLINQIIKKKLKNGFIGVSIDSKKIKKNNLFVAIKGTKHDGHDFIKDSLRKGAKYCIVSKKSKKNYSKKLIKVSNTSIFLKKLAEIKRLNTKAKIIAVTGSSGKTTVKNLLGNLLKTYDKSYFSPKSFNNHFGVPLSISNLEQSFNYGVFEVGMSRRGEIFNLSKIIKPNIGIITNVAEAHIENFNTLKDIAKAKSEIIDNICEGGCLVINKDDKFFDYFKNKAEKNNVKVYSFGLNKKADVYPISFKKLKGYNYLKAMVFDEVYELNFKDHYLINILNVLTVINLLKLNMNKITKKIRKINLSEGRGKIHKVKMNRLNFNFIDESYNANPLSMKKSINRLSKIKADNINKYVLLGDMLELGSKSNILHQNLSKFINESDIDKLFIQGDKIMKTYKFVKKNKRGNILQQNSDFFDTLLPMIKNNDYLMIKGSNATGLNKISDKLLKGKYNAL